MAEQVAHVRMSVVWTNERAVNALNVLLRTLEEVGEDFEYRDDVKRAIRAARFLAKNVGVQSHVGDVVHLMDELT